MIPEVVLEMKHIRKEFPGVVALEDVDFNLKRGEVHVLLGENGAGKSTLMKIVSGAYEKDEGEIRIEEENVEITSTVHEKELGIGIIYKEFILKSYLSVSVIICLFCA